MNKLRKDFSSELSKLKYQIKNLNKKLKEPSLYDSITPQDVDQINSTWLKIDSNAGLSDFISLHEYRRLKAEKDNLIEEVTTWLNQKVTEFNSVDDTNKVSNDDGNDAINLLMIKKS